MRLLRVSLYFFFRCVRPCESTRCFRFLCVSVISGSFVYSPHTNIIRQSGVFGWGGSQMCVLRRRSSFSLAHSFSRSLLLQVDLCWVIRGRRNAIHTRSRRTRRRAHTPPVDSCHPSNAHAQHTVYYCVRARISNISFVFFFLLFRLWPPRPPPSLAEHPLRDTSSGRSSCARTLNTHISLIHTRTYHIPYHICGVVPVAVWLTFRHSFVLCLRAEEV